MGTLDPAPPVAPPAPAPAPAQTRPGFAWRLLSPLGAVVLAFVLLVIGAGILEAADRSEESIAAILGAATSLLLLVFGIALWRGLPPHERRLAVGLKGPAGLAIAIGLGIGVALLIGALAIVAAGAAIDPTVERRLDEVEDIGTAPWQLVLLVVALVVLAPLGEELLFRGLLLRALARRIRFWTAALIASLLFAAAHYDSYLLWPRAIALVGTGVVLAWLYRRWGYWASVTAHAVVNTVAATVLVATS